MDKLVKPMEASNGKGDKQRPTNKEKYDKNYERIFNGQKSNSKQKKQTKAQESNKKSIPK